MKTPFLFAVLSLSLISSFAQASAGTSSGGGLFAPESEVQCQFNDNHGHEVKVAVLSASPSTGIYEASVQEATLSGLFAPLSFANVQRDLISESEVRFQAPGFNLVLNLPTEPTLETQGQLIAAGVNAGQAVSVSCQVSY